MARINSIEIKDLIGEKQRLATQIVELYDKWEENRTEWKNRQAETISYLYATSTKETENAENGHGHSTHIPKLTQIYDNLTANISYATIPNERFFSFMSDNSTDSTKEKSNIIEGYLRTKHRGNKFNEVNELLINDFLAYGNCFAQVTYENRFVEVDGEKIKIYSGPEVIRINPMDIVFSPQASSFENSPKIIRSIVTLGELARMAEENIDIGYNEEIIRLMREDRNNIVTYNDTVKSNKQLEADGFGMASNYYTNGFVEILEFYGDIMDLSTGINYKNHIITIVDRRYVLRSETNKTWTGKPAIFNAGWRKRPDNLWAMGPIDNLTSMQYSINHLENSKADALDDMLFPDRVFKGTPEIETHEDGSQDFFFDEQGDISYLRPDVTILNIDTQIAQKMEMMELFAGAPREAMGIRTPGEKTATEVTSLNNASARFFQNKAKDYERFIESILNAEIEVARRNLETLEEIKVLDIENGVEQFLTISKEDLKGDGRIYPVGVSNYTRLTQLYQTLLSFEQALQYDPEMREHFSSAKKAELYEELLGFDKFNLFDKNIRLYERGEYEIIKMQVQQTVQEASIIQQEELQAKAGIVPPTQEQQVI